jgi:NAD-dependent dihydropyrimidine dehydrogenase PreA subunit
MNDHIHQRLRERIDSYSVGFSTTPSGIEIKILQKIFSPEEAELYLHMERKLERVEDIAQKAGKTAEEIKVLLDGMKKKGLLFPKKKNGIQYYALAPFMHGFFEHQSVLGLDYELAKMYEDYMWGGFIPKTRSLRTVPIDVSLDSNKTVMPYDDIKKIIDSKNRIGLMPCACAAKMKVLKSGCNQSLNVCIAFDFYAEYAIEEYGVGRWITQEEALQVIRKSEDEGLVHQVGGDNRNVECICNCCTECCNLLRFFTIIPNPAKFAGSNYFSSLDHTLCNLCEICIERCPMNAIKPHNDTLTINLERCIGCGLCTTTCPTEAIMLKMKPADKIKPPPSPDRYTFMRSSLDYDKDVE